MPIQGGELDANENKKNTGGSKAPDAEQKLNKDSAGPGPSSQANEQGPQERPIGPASGPASGPSRRPPGAGKEEIDSSAPSATNPGTGNIKPDEIGNTRKKGPEAERQGPGDASRSREPAPANGNGRPNPSDTNRKSTEQSRPSTISNSERSDTSQQRPQQPEIEEEPNWFVKTYRKIRDSIYNFCCQTEDNIRHIA